MAEAFVLVPGYSGSRVNWPNEFSAQLSKRMDVVLIDNRGTGESSPLERDKAYSVSTFAQDLLDTLSLLHYEKFHLIGHSLGGCIALEAAVGAPHGRIASLTLVSSIAGGPSYVPSQRELMMKLALPPGETLFERTLVIWDVCLGSANVERFRAEIERQFDLSSKHPIPGFTLKTQLTAYQQFDRSTQPLDLPFPVSIIHGRNDRITPYENSLALQKVIPQAQLSILEPCEHIPYMERTDDCLRIIDQMLSGGDRQW